jgi:hypothetical protein
MTVAASRLIRCAQIVGLLVTGLLSLHKPSSGTTVPALLTDHELYDR